MNKKILIAGFLVSVMLLIPINSAYSNIGIQIENKPVIQSNRGNTLYVGGNGSGNYSKIQDAIDDANDGDTVFVYDDSSPYDENIIIDKSIKLVGENRDSTVIDAKNEGTPIIIISNNVLVSEFTILNMEDSFGTDWDVAMIQVIKCQNVNINNNIINPGDRQTTPAYWYGAIDLYECSNCVISNNVITHNYDFDRNYGIVLRSSSNNIISGNDISKFNYGICNSWFENSNNNIISENHLHHNIWGINCVYNNYNNILNNTLDYNSYIGINIDGSHHNTISGNVLLNNGESTEFACGLMLSSEECSDNIVSDNIISNNKPTGIYVLSSFDNVITRNNFIDNYGEGRTPKKWWGNAYFNNPLEKWRFFNLNTWKSNYWSDLSSNIKIIKGNLYFPLFNIPWFAFDWSPVKKQYDI